MTEKELQKCAGILVESGYAVSFYKFEFYWLRFDYDKEHARVNPFSNTLESRQQLDAIHNYIYKGDAHKEIIDAVKRGLIK